LSREHTLGIPPFANVTGIPAQFGIQGVPQFPLNGGLPPITINNLNPIGDANWLPADRFSNTMQLTENLTKVYKSHVQGRSRVPVCQLSLAVPAEFQRRLRF
jgi:hypothetical protein